MCCDNVHVVLYGMIKKFIVKITQMRSLLHTYEDSFTVQFPYRFILFINATIVYHFY